MIRKGMFIGDRYEIIDKVGSGGMSDVYKAKDHKLNRFVAVKVLKSEFCEDKSFVSKFKIEAQSAAGLAHPNIVNVYDVGEDQGIYYIVMELIEGITLKKYIEKKGKLPIKDAISIAIQVAQGIEAAHNNHIVHRDIKPQNIIISREGKVKVTDFGIARAASANTINSNAMGSVHYISPEQARGGYIDEKSDIYSLGITLYEMITGKVPFEGDSTVTIALQHIQEEIPSAKMFVPELPISVAKIIEKCAQKKPERRYLKVSSLIADLKKSLISPDEDFVVIPPATNNSATIMITDDEISVIKENAGMKSVDDIDEVEGEEVEAGEEAENEEDAWLNESDDIDEGSSKFDKAVAIGGIVAAIAILIVAILIFSKSMKSCGGSESNPKETQNTTEATSNAKNTTVPDLYEMTEDEAIEALTKANLKYKIETATSDKVDEGCVMAQNVKAGNTVSKGTTVTITISEGGEEKDIPDVVGKSYDEALKLLSVEYGLEVVSKYETVEEYDKNVVFKTEPEAPIKLKRGDKITLYISLGEDELAEIPDVSTKTKEAAIEELEKLGFVVDVEEAYHDTIKSGRVISTDREVGTELPKGETITITVSKGKEPETTTKPKETETKPKETETKQPETTTTTAKTYTATFSKFDYSKFTNIPTVPSEEETTTGPNGETEEIPTVNITTGTLTAYITYKNGSSTITTDVTSKLTSTEFSESFAQTSNIEINTDVAELKGEDATLKVYVTYEGGTGEVLVYEDTAVFN